MGSVKTEAPAFAISPKRVMLKRPGSQQFTVNRNQDVVTWSVFGVIHRGGSNDAEGSVDGKGLYTAGSEPGKYQVQAVAGDESATAEVTVV